MTGFHSDTKVTAPKKVPKKSGDTTEFCSPEADIISDTTPHAINSIKSWRQIYEILDYEIKNSPNDSEIHLWDIAESELHKIAICPWLITYNDMVIWALEKIDIPTRSILNNQAVIIESFELKHIQVM